MLKGKKGEREGRGEKERRDGGREGGTEGEKGGNTIFVLSLREVF